MKKPAVSCGPGHIYGRNLKWKTSFFVQQMRQLILTQSVEESAGVSMEWQCFEQGQANKKM